MTVGPVETQHRAPVVEHERDALTHRESLEQGIEKGALLRQPVALGAAGCQPAGIAHADQVGRDAPPERLDPRDDVAPQVG